DWRLSEEEGSGRFIYICMVVEAKVHALLLPVLASFTFAWWSQPKSMRSCFQSSLAAYRTLTLQLRQHLQLSVPAHACSVLVTTLGAGVSGARCGGPVDCGGIDVVCASSL
ncbi:unnamed protein product, partial [Aphanomyces euteiches]